jgi:membrane protein implicated in regulation of membrane protease activity
MSEPLEFVSEGSDLATGVAILTFALAPFALPLLALTVLVAAMLAIPALLGAMLVGPLVIAWRRWRSRDRVPRAAGQIGRVGDIEVRRPSLTAAREATPVVDPQSTR